jgi:hypothetical protein
MNYWPVDSANLPGCFESYFRLIRRIRESGTDTARRMYGCRGFVLHNNTDLWADTAVQDAGVHCSYWFSGGFWWRRICVSTTCTPGRDYTCAGRGRHPGRGALRPRFSGGGQEGRLVMGVNQPPPRISYLDAGGRRASFCRMTAMDSS